MAYGDSWMATLSRWIYSRWNRWKLRRRKVPRLQGAADRGRWGEAYAADFLRARGLTILAHRVRTPRGEIDIIARDGPVWVFVEVKTRSNRYPWKPDPIVSPYQRRRIVHAALNWMRQRGLRCVPVRFDVVVVWIVRDVRRPCVDWYRGVPYRYP